DAAIATRDASVVARNASVLTTGALQLTARIAAVVARRVPVVAGLFRLDDAVTAHRRAAARAVLHEPAAQLVRAEVRRCATEAVVDVRDRLPDVDRVTARQP